MNKNTVVCDVCGDVLPVDDCSVNPMTGLTECSDCRKYQQETEDCRG